MSKPTPNERRLIVAYLNARSQARRAETPGEERTAQMALMMARGAALLYLRLQPETKRTKRLIKNLEQGRGTSYRKPPADIETGYVPEDPHVLARAAQAEAGYNLRHAAIRAQKSQAALAELYKQGHALKAPDGTFSNGIENAQDVHDAISTVGLNTKVPLDQVRKHIMIHAALHGVTPPANWNQDGSLKKAA